MYYLHFAREELSYELRSNKKLVGGPGWCLNRFAHAH